MGNEVDLTPREREVLALITLPRKEIARRLGISDGTVQRHFLNLYQKLGVHNRAEAALKAIPTAY